MKWNINNHSIKEKRLYLGIPFKEFSILTKISMPRLSHLEQWKYLGVTNGELKKIYKVLIVETEKFLENLRFEESHIKEE